MLPPDWVASLYRDLRPPAVFSLQDAARHARSSVRARQFCHIATKHRWIVRRRRGEYVALDPSLAIRVSFLSGYWQELVALHAAMQISKTAHRFACLTAMQLADYVPSRPMPVLATTERDLFDGVAFGHASRAARPEALDVLGISQKVATTRPEETALLLAATQLPREVAAARDILRGRRVGRAFAAHLNAVGLATRDDVTESKDPHVSLPEWVRERRAGLADELLRGSLG